MTLPVPFTHTASTTATAPDADVLPRDVFVALESQQSLANKDIGPRQTPQKVLTVPQVDVSAQAQALIAAPYRLPAWNADPVDANGWRELICSLAESTLAGLAAARERLGVTIQSVNIGGVPGFLLEPASIPAHHVSQLILNLHGGGYVYGPGESGTMEATLIAAYSGYKVLAVDYRMPPDFPYPAAMDDAMAAWKGVLDMAPSANIGLTGTSTGGAMALALVMRAKSEGIALPGALAIGTPWSDLTETGDSYRTNEWIDNIVVSHKGYLGRAAALYANGHDLKDPQLSPVYGDFHAFPPTQLFSGTRDLFLSNTIRVHRKLRQAGTEADLHVFEGLSHAQHFGDPLLPEAQETCKEIGLFFDRHLAH